MNQIHVQIMKFVCCLNMVLLENPQDIPTWVCLHDIMRQNVAARNEHVVYDFVDVNVSGNDDFDVQFCMLMPSCTKGSNV